MTLLETRDLSCGYGDLVVVRELKLRVEAGSVVALLGANGAGKTTTLLTLAGLLRPVAGSVEVLGNPTAGRAPNQLARSGLGFIPDDRGLFPHLTVRENLVMAGIGRSSRVDPLADFPELAGRHSAPAGILSGGQQQMLAIARALARQPKVLLIDELSLGLAPIVARRLLPVLREIAARGCGVLLVEQHVHLALDIADYAYVMSRGRIAVEGPAAELRDNPAALRSSYLGEAR
jgi:branched-chain amino acid transport system ATP-binding protein